MMSVSYVLLGILMLFGFYILLWFSSKVCFFVYLDIDWLCALL